MASHLVSRRYYYPSMNKKSKSFLRTLHNIILQIIDPGYAWEGIYKFFRFAMQWRKYNLLLERPKLKWRDCYPQIHDDTNSTPFDPHYFYTNGWAMRRIVANSPRFHVDIASHNLFADLLSAVVPVVFIDYRPLNVNLDGLVCRAGDILALPYENNSIFSLSSLHVIEHIGLGRYGDPLDPHGTQKALTELSRVLAPGGNFYLSTPIGRERVCFNAHRIHNAQSICAMVPGLVLVEFSGVTDKGEYIENAEFELFTMSEYSCGLFWFKKPS
jgi:SAM-dependent methyltransferase